MSTYPSVARIKSVEAFRGRLTELGIDLPVDDAILSANDDSPLARPLQVGNVRVGNRWCIHPMEGWDANPDGSPSAHTLRRWRNFGRSGAKLIWGGEAAAVQLDGRANPNQTLATDQNKVGLSQLLDELRTAHQEEFGAIEDLLVGLQLTHSGRFSRPNGKQLEPRIAYHHPLLDAKFGIDADNDSVVWTDDELEQLIDRYVVAAGLAADVGFQFVDIKACHGYLLHEFLSARSRPGRYGGDLEGRTRLLREIIRRVRADYPDLMIGVRISAFDIVPFKTSQETGQPLPFDHLLPYRWGFGVDADNPLEVDLSEPIQVLKMLRDLGVALINVSCGSPYYNPHIQRPAMFPPSDGYMPPEDPLLGVARQIHVTRQCKESLAGNADAAVAVPVVGSGYSYLQDFLPHVAQAVIRDGWVDSVGLGRMVLSYPQLPADTARHATTRRSSICRTFSDCTTAPRHGMLSGCYPLDAYYKELPEAAKVRAVKQEMKNHQ